MASPSKPSPKPPRKTSGHWQSSLTIVYSILGFWAFISLGCGVLFRDMLDRLAPSIGGAPFGFWVAQQGAILGFLVLLFVYMVLMNRLDEKHGYGPEDTK